LSGNNQLSALFFTSANKGYAVGYNGTLLHFE